MLLEKCDVVKMWQREQYWIKKLNTLTPHGLNIRVELPPPLPFGIKYSDQASKFNKVVKAHYKKIQERLYNSFQKLQFVTAYKRNKNLKDMLVTSKLPQD